MTLPITYNSTASGNLFYDSVIYFLNAIYLSVGKDKKTDPESIG